MNTFFECRVKAMKIDQNGVERKVSDAYLIDAVSYTDAEARITEKMRELIRGDFSVASIKQSNITDILPGEGEFFWKAKISFVTIDEQLGREKKANQYLLVSADCLDDAVVSIHNGLDYMLAPYCLEQVLLSTIIDVFPFN